MLLVSLWTNTFHGEFLTQPKNSKIPLPRSTNCEFQTESLKGACESKPGETEILMGYVVYDDENCDGTNDTLASDLKNLIDINQVE